MTPQKTPNPTHDRLSAGATAPLTRTHENSPLTNQRAVFLNHLGFASGEGTVSKPMRVRRVDVVRRCRQGR